MAESLRTELLSIDGIAGAELEGSEDAPQGVRVQLAAGADAELVGREVQRVLANHGMRSHRSAPGDDTAMAGAEDPSDSTVEPAIGGPPPPPGAERSGANILPIRAAAIANQDAIGHPATSEQLDSVAVEEGRSGITVSVTAAGITATRHLGSAGLGLDAAIVGAVAELLGVEAQLAAVHRAEADDAQIVTVLADLVGAGRQVGSAVVGAGEAFALGQAAWRALTAQG